MYNYLDFEKPVSDLEGKILELKKLAESGEAVDVADEIARLEKRSRDALRDIYKALTPWQKVQVARHPDRPHCLDYVNGLFTDFTPLAGDRAFGEDQAIVGGFAPLPRRAGRRDRPGEGLRHQEPAEAQFRHRPSRKATARRCASWNWPTASSVPVITLVDTAGAYPGIGAEERGQAEAIARSTSACLALKVPSMSVVIGEGGSGGAIAIATANRVYMLEHAIYSVISPEGAASILWRDSTRAKDAATNMKITAQDLLDLKIIDGIIPEPLGGAHRAPEAVIAATGDLIARTLAEFAGAEHGFPRAAAREIPGDGPQPLISRRRGAALRRNRRISATKMPPPVGQ